MNAPAHPYSALTPDLVIGAVEAFLVSAERGVWAVFVTTTIAVGTMWTLLLTNRFDVADVAGYSNRSLGWNYKITALWGSQAGSLLPCSSNALRWRMAFS